jgi:hypothetical protein
MNMEWYVYVYIIIIIIIISHLFIRILSYERV